jgi:hypothetical protein
VSFVHSKASRVFLNAVHQSAQITGYSVQGSRAYGDTTALADEGNRYTPGLRSGSLTVNGNFNADAAALDVTFQAAMGTDNSALWTVCPNGYALGSPCFIVNSDPQGYDITASVADTVTVALDSMPDDGVDRGIVLHTLEAETSDTNETSVDNSAATSNGGAASLHVTAYSGLTSAALKVQHSTDNSVWVDLVTFTSVTATTYEHKTVTGTVNRYLRATTDVTGTGSVTFVAAFARR